MMTQQKTFDCVEMKNRAQAELQQEIEGMTPEEELNFHRNYPLSKGLQDLWESIPETPVKTKSRAA